MAKVEITIYRRDLNKLVWQKPLEDIVLDDIRESAVSKEMLRKASLIIFEDKNGASIVLKKR